MPSGFCLDAELVFFSCGQFHDFADHGSCHCFEHFRPYCSTCLSLKYDVIGNLSSTIILRWLPLRITLSSVISLITTGPVGGPGLSSTTMLMKALVFVPLELAAVISYLPASAATLSLRLMVRFSAVISVLNLMVAFSGTPSFDKVTLGSGFQKWNVHFKV